jgi:hypothetical protein
MVGVWYAALLLLLCLSVVPPPERLAQKNCSNEYTTEW